MPVRVSAAARSWVVSTEMKGVRSVPLARPTTGLAASEQVKAPSGVTFPKPPMVDKRQNVGASNLTKTRWQTGSGPKKLGNHR